MKQLYRSPPPYALAEQAARSLGLFNLQDVKWFDPSFYSPTEASLVLDEIIPYYFPCFARAYANKEQMTFPKYMTVCRQLFRYHGIQLDRKDKCIGLGESTYQIVPKYRIKLECLTNVNQEVSLS